VPVPSLATVNAAPDGERRRHDLRPLPMVTWQTAGPGSRKRPSRRDRAPVRGRRERHDRPAS